VRYFIKWKRKIDGRFGRSVNEYYYEEAIELCKSLNLEYPDFEHTVCPVPASQISC